MNISDVLYNDKEIQELKKQLYDIVGSYLGYNYDCYTSVEEYKKHLRECVSARKIVVREKDEVVMRRFCSLGQREQE